MRLIFFLLLFYSLFTSVVVSHLSYQTRCEIFSQCNT
ncbi:hypothetical protein GLYMA_08G192150v4 [Glycine max]|nr:hypothetical protein GLYMA_08G192150v4 [Glycine max]KAH1052020.1 hypothetical protein GYH30_021737 [Glycine max]